MTVHSTVSRFLLNLKRPTTYQIRERQWREQFDETDGTWLCLVVEHPTHELVGFAKGNRYQSDDLPGYHGELSKIYLLREYQRLGLGRRLMGHVARRFLGEGITRWCSSASQAILRAPARSSR